ncbi:nuclear factor related to kappa-B-binding protein [Elysia marginata]|uniref:Nuclear factor related to kappa-B-binding protein n=1 Tax=Elysia marginata TaxID=1093978 RepID=A0AAV4F1X0_9GAST|nr:nuclear factor related to kappa-B-binding protein [Elysia marginata]
MEESDHEMSDEAESDNDAWAGLIPGPDERMEQCKLGGKVLKLPELFLEKKHIFKSVLSMDTWNATLSVDQKSRLEALLPSFPARGDEEIEKTLMMLFNGENIKFGNPLQDLQKKLKEGYLHPEIARYRKQTRQFRYRDYKMRQQRRLSDLLKRLLLSRQELFEHATALAPGDPIKFQCPPPPVKKISPMEQIIKKKTIRILKEVREECGFPDTSSDEDEESTSPVQRSRRQLFKSLGPIPSPEPTIPSVLATYATKPVVPPPSSSIPLVNGDAHHHGPEGQAQVTSSAQAKRPRPISPVEVTEDSYKFMLRLHKRKRLLQPDLPELDTSSVNLQDILARCQANKKNLKGGAAAEMLPTNLNTMKKRLKIKAKGDKKSKLKPKEPSTLGAEDDVMLPRLPSPSLDASSSFPAPDSLPDDPLKTVFGPSLNFFCLLRDILLEFPDGKTSIPKFEERLQEWLEQNDQILNPWMALLNTWEEQVMSAMKFLSGTDQGTQQIEFSPMVELCSSKEKHLQFRWVGPPGLDSDSQLKDLFRLWLQAKQEANNSASGTVDVVSEISASAPGSPPPPKAKTNFIVRPTSNNEKALFREQERSRFASPHKAFTFMMHGYDSVVGPVKGVYDKDSSTNKAREHNLLVSDRPPFVTILTLVRDAAARLPNGEGTRGDICELLKDSQFLAPGVTDTQINAVVSGALDRLHSEKDPCVKYDVTRKLWIYLHRNRTEDEFERIHQAQAATAKTKKTVSKPKAAKLVKDLAGANPTGASSVLVQPTLPSSPLHQPSFTLSTMQTTVPSPSQQPPPVTTKLASSESASLLTKSGKSATLLRTPSLGVGGPLPPGVTSLTPTIAQLRAAQAAMAKSASSGSSGNSVGKLQTVKQLTSGGAGHLPKKVATLGGLSSTASSSGAASSVGSPLLTVTSLGLSMNSSSSTAIFSSPSLSVSSSLAAQLLYSPGISLGSASPLTAVSSLHQQNLHPTQHNATGKQKSSSSSASSSSSSPSTPSLSLSSISLPVSTATTFSLVTTLNTGAAVAGSGTPTALRTPTISMLQSQQLLKQQQQQQLLLKQQQQQQQQQTASQSILRQNAALVAAVGQTIALAKSSDSVNASAVSSITTGGKSTSSAAIMKPHTFTLTARPSPTPNVAVTKNTTAISSLKPSLGSMKQTSLILSQEGVASLTSATGGVAPGGKLVALTSVAGQQAGEGTVMAQIMQQAAVAQHTGGVKKSAHAIRLQDGNIVQPIISGKPIQIGGKPFGTAKGLVQLAGKGGQPLGLIRTPQRPLSTINLIPQPTVSAAAGKTATVVAVGSSSSSLPASPSALTTTASSSSNIVTTSASSRHSQQLAAFAPSHNTKSNAGPGQAKILGQTPAGLVVTQFTPGNIALRAGSGQAKVLPSGQASLVPTQFILQHAPAAVATSQGTSAPIIVSSNAAGGKGAQNLQVMRTVLSQPGNLKPGQATIFISQPTLPQVAVSSAQGLTAAQMLQAGAKTSGRGSPKGKGQPVYARIITPPPGMKLSSVAQVPIPGGGGGVVTNAAAGTASAGNSNINVIQTVGGKLTLVTTGMATHSLSSLPLVSLAMVNSATSQVVVAAGDAPGSAVSGKDVKVEKMGPDGS